VLVTLLAVAVLTLLWYQTFAVTGVTTPVVPPGTQRPQPPPAPALTALPTAEMPLEQLAERYPIWSALGN
jgi:hypothetical protein